VQRSVSVFTAAGVIANTTRVGLRNEPAETILPRLARLDLVTVDSRRKTSEFKPGQQLVGEGE